MAAKQRNTFSLLVFLSLSSMFCYGQTSLPIVKTPDNLWAVTLKVNDKTVNLLIDTGASISVINPRKIGLSALEVSALPSVPIKGFVTGKSLPIATVRVRLTKGVSEYSVGIAEIPGLSTDGVLGNDILGHFSKMHFNYKEKTLVLD